MGYYNKFPSPSQPSLIDQIRENSEEKSTRKENEISTRAKSAEMNDCQVSKWKLILVLEYSFFVIIILVPALFLDFHLLFL
jgi:hypothetical protein